MVDKDKALQGDRPKDAEAKRRKAAEIRTELKRFETENAEERQSPKSPRDFIQEKMRNNEPREKKEE